MMNGSFGLMGGFMWIFWIAVIVGLFFLVKWIIHQSKPVEQKHAENALEVLKGRYARGEIDRKEFEQKKEDLLA